MLMDNNVVTTKSNTLTEKNTKKCTIQPEISQQPIWQLQLKTKSTRRRSQRSYLHKERKNLPALTKPLTYKEGSAVRSLCITTNSQWEGRGEGKGESKDRKNFGRQKHRREGKWEMRKKWMA